MKQIPGKKRFVASLAVVAAACAPAVAWAVPEPPGTIGEFIEASDLVFRGHVVHIEYAASQPSQSQPDGLPHTFVTYAVMDVLHGDDPGALVTLRFLGGLKAGTSLYLMLDTPQFDIGDEDILFVTGNGEKKCPLVSKCDGRLRVIDGLVYSDDGREVAIHSNGAIGYGERHDLIEVMTTTIGGQVLSLDLASDAASGPSSSVAASTALAEIAHASRLIPFAHRRFVNCDPAERFAGPQHKRVDHAPRRR